MRVLPTLVVILIIGLALTIGCKQKNAPTLTTVAEQPTTISVSEDQELEKGLGDLNSLGQLEKELNNITLEELDNISLE
ncbi:hypothetical protein HZC32_03230 [Candidatus Woesearchaeota archaeon]|nr:hypothetical protein [Candidatus Woesearchaeota archaeon]